mgnify:CR=1 FL=1
MKGGEEIKKYLTLGMTLVLAIMAVTFVSAGLFGITGNALWDWNNYCTASSPCGIGEGDCDGPRGSEFVADDGTKWRKSDQCKSGYCHLNVGANYGQASSMDVCEDYVNSTEIPETNISNSTTSNIIGNKITIKKCIFPEKNRNSTGTNWELCRCNSGKVTGWTGYNCEVMNGVWGCSSTAPYGNTGIQFKHDGEADAYVWIYCLI